MKRRKLNRKLNTCASRLGVSVVGNGYVMKRWPRKRNNGDLRSFRRADEEIVTETDKTPVRGCTGLCGPSASATGKATNC